MSQNFFFFFFFSNTILKIFHIVIFENLREQALANGLSIGMYSQNYALERSRLEKPLAFICHDSRDKAQVARPIAIGLSKLMCPVWYDEFSLKVGDRLRESIEKGLRKECKKCVLVLSPQFFGNTGWTRVEFNSIFTREIIETEDSTTSVVRRREGTVGIEKGRAVRLEGIAKDDPSCTPKRVGIIAQSGRARLIQGLKILYVLRSGIDQKVVIEHTGRLVVR